MKKSLNAITYGLSMVVAAGMVFMSSCSKDGDDPEPEPEIATLSFEVTELTVNEADGEVEIKLVLDKPAAEDFTVEYDVSGSAREKVVNPLNGVYDYEIVDGPGEVEFEEGDESAVIVLKLYSDFSFESLTTPETINLSIEDVDSDLIEISRDDEIDIALKQEDGTLVFLGSGPDGPDGEAYEDVDMDLIFWIKDENGDLQPTNIASAYASSEPEFIFFPKVFDDDTYGFSYTYFSGTPDPMKFFVVFIEIINGVVEPEDDHVIFEGEYTAANKNDTWDQEGGAPLVLAQTFDMEDNVFTNFSELNIEETSSRVRAKKPANLNRMPVSEQAALPEGIRRR